MKNIGEFELGRLPRSRFWGKSMTAHSHFHSISPRYRVAEFRDKPHLVGRSLLKVDLSVGDSWYNDDA